MPAAEVAAPVPGAAYIMCHVRVQGLNYMTLYRYRYLKIILILLVIVSRLSLRIQIVIISRDIDSTALSLCRSEHA